MDKEKIAIHRTDAHSVKVLPALLIAIGITLLGIFIRNGLGGISSNQRVVTVRGLCEREFEANKVTWLIVSKAMGNDLTVLYSQIESTNNAITSFLKSNGIPESEFSVNAPQVNDPSGRQIWQPDCAIPLHRHNSRGGDFLSGQKDKRTDGETDPADATGHPPWLRATTIIRLSMSLPISIK